MVIKVISNWGAWEITGVLQISGWVGEEARGNPAIVRRFLWQPACVWGLPQQWPPTGTITLKFIPVKKRAWLFNTYCLCQTTIGPGRLRSLFANSKVVIPNCCKNGRLQKDAIKLCQLKQVTFKNGWNYYSRYGFGWRLTLP